MQDVDEEDKAAIRSYINGKPAALWQIIMSKITTEYRTTFSKMSLQTMIRRQFTYKKT